MSLRQILKTDDEATEKEKAQGYILISSFQDDMFPWKRPIFGKLSDDEIREIVSICKVCFQF